MKILRYGAFGPQVELLQVGLIRAGFSFLKPDGRFGQMTEDAVRQFQADNGLIPDGVFGPITYGVMQRYLLGYFTYLVEKNDTLSGISARFGITLASLRAANPKINNLIYPGLVLTIPMPFHITFTDISFSSLTLEMNINGLLKRYPFIRKQIIGMSILGKPILCLIIGQGENEVFYNASHHGNEWITTPVLLKFIEEYASAYVHGKNIHDQKAKELYQKTTIFLVPMVNPDGVDLVVGEIPPDSEIYHEAYLLNNNAVNFPLNWKANIRGVDLNINYPAFWRNARETKYAQGITTPGSRDYVGPTPLSEPETQAIAIFTLQHHFRLTLSYHSQGEVIYWKFLDFEPPLSWDIATQFAKVSGYKVEETPIQSGYAGYKDWFILTYNLPGYTIEVGLGDNPLPIMQFDKIYKDNLGILVLGAVL